MCFGTWTRFRRADQVDGKHPKPFAARRVRGRRVKPDRRVSAEFVEYVIRKPRHEPVEVRQVDVAVHALTVSHGV